MDSRQGGAHQARLKRNMPSPSSGTAVAAPDVVAGPGAGLALQHGEAASAKSLVTHVEAAQDLPVSATTVEGQARAVG